MNNTMKKAMKKEDALGDNTRDPLTWRMPKNH